MYRRWLYCPNCGWQDDNPLPDAEQRASGVCPACTQNGMLILAMERRDWMKHGAELVSKKVTVRELVRRETARLKGSEVGRKP